MGKTSIFLVLVKFFKRKLKTMSKSDMISPASYVVLEDFIENPGFNHIAEKIFKCLDVKGKF